MAKVLGFLIRYFSNYYTLHRDDLAARAAPLDPRLLRSSDRRKESLSSKEVKEAEIDIFRLSQSGLSGDRVGSESQGRV